MVKVRVNQIPLKNVVKVDFSKERNCLFLVMKDGSQVDLEIKKSV